MITTTQETFLQHIRVEFQKLPASNLSRDPRFPFIANAWTKYLIDNYYVMECYDSMRGRWLDFGTDAAEERFNTLAEQHQMLLTLMKEPA